MVDTNSDPNQIDYVIPSNDDASKSIEAILAHVTGAVAEGLSERKSEKTAEKEGNSSSKLKLQKLKQLQKKLKAEAPKAEQLQKLKQLQKLRQLQQMT